MIRTDGIALVMATVFAVHFPSAVVAEETIAESKTRVQHRCGQEPFRLVFEAEWNDIPCADYPLTPAKWAAECFGPLVNTQVDCLLYNLCSSDAYCCQLNNGELLMDAFDKLSSAWVWRYRENTKRLIAADANPPKLACEYGHRLGMLVIPMVRMNDPHDMFFRYEVSRFKQANSHLLLGSTGPDWKPDWDRNDGGPTNKYGMNGRTWGMFDYAHREVREHKLAIIEEFITRWDNDGVGLDFDRDPRLFKEEGKPENAALITDMIRQIRATLDRVAKERGRPQYLYVRVIPDIDICVARGLDVRTWVREGLVDVVAPGCGYVTFSLDPKPWLGLVSGTKCRVVASNNHWKPTEETRAWAKLMRQRGAYGVQLFNYGHLLHGHRPDVDPRSAPPLGTVWFNELHPDYYRVLSELGELGDYSFKNCRYALESMPHISADPETPVTQRKYRGIGGIVLPVSLTTGKYVIPFGFADDLETARTLGLDPKVTLRAQISNPGSLAEYKISVNGQELLASAAPAADGWASFIVPNKCLRLGENELLVAVDRVQAGPSPQLEKVEIDVSYIDLPASRTKLLGLEPVATTDVKSPVPLTVGQHTASFELKQEVIDSLVARADANLILRMRVNNYTYYDDFDVSLNGHSLQAKSRRTRATFIMEDQSWIDYPIPHAMLQQDANVVQFDVRALNPQMSSTPELNRIEVLVDIH